MVEYGPAAILGIFKTVNAVESAVRNGGIVGDRKHGTGYHRSRNALRAAGRAGDYSIQDDRDKRGDGDAASAFDLTMSDVLMRKLTARLVAAMRARDPRVVGKLREFGGTLDSRKVTAYRVEDQRAVSFDATHLWHIHGSIFRQYANDVAVCQGIAAVLLGVPLVPFTWDGSSFPGAEHCQIGCEGAWVTWLGERLVAHGWKGYSDGPGPTFTEVDRQGVEWFQELQGWSGDDADGFPGPETWKRLAAAPVVAPQPPVVTPPPAKPDTPAEPPAPPVPAYPAPTTDLVYEEVIYPGRTKSDSVWQIQTALRKLGFSVEVTGDYDAQTVEAAKRFQASLGDKDVDGALGPLQTARLFKDAGVRVTYVPKDPPPAPKPPAAPATLKIATWNGYKANSLGNWRKGFDAVRAEGALVLGVQELSNDTLERQVKAYAESKGWGATKRNSAVTILWDDARVRLVEETYKLVTSGGERWESGAGGGDAIYKIIMIGVFEVRATGARFTVLNTHLPPTIEKGGKFDPSKPIRIRYWRKQLADWTAAFSKYGARGPVFGMADTNADWQAEPGKEIEREFDKVGATVCWDEFADKPTHSTRTIDYVIAKGVSKWVSLKVLPKYGSDHSPVVAEVITA